MELKYFEDDRDNEARFVDEKETVCNQFETNEVFRRGFSILKNTNIGDRDEGCIHAFVVHCIYYKLDIKFGLCYTFYAQKIVYNINIRVYATLL